MDCITISTYRNLEQQAIRQYKELKARDAGMKLILRDTFGKENPCYIRSISYLNGTNEPNEPSKSTDKGINYYA